MKQAGLAVGLGSGLLVALLFIAGASAIGPSVLHIDLAPKASSLSAPTGASDQAGGVGPSLSQPTAPTPHVSSLDSISTDTGAALGLLLIPIVVGIAGGVMVYALWARRVEAE